MNNSIISQMKENLGFTYETFSYFFNEIFKQNKYNNIIIMSRKCFTLYKLYDKAISGDRGTIANKIISDKALPFRDDGIKADGKYLVIDDVRIHGRTLNEIIQELTSIGVTYDKIDVSVGLNSRNESLIPNEINFQFVECVDMSRIRQASNDMIRLFNETLTANTSFVISYQGLYKWSNIETFCSRFSDIPCSYIENTELMESSDSYKSYVIFWDEKVFPRCGFIEKECCRVYVDTKKDPNQSKICIIPYVFIKPLKRDDLKKIVEKLKVVLCEENQLTDVLQTLLDDVHEEQKALGMMRLITCLFSIALKSRINIFQEVNNLASDAPVIEMSYYQGFAKSIEYIEENLLNKFDKIDLSVEDYNLQENSKLSTCLNTAVSNHRKYSREVLKEYFRLDNMAYEEYLHKKVEKSEIIEHTEGLSTGYIVSQICKNYQSMELENLCYSHMLNIMDSGKATLNIKAFWFKGTVYYLTVESSGEMNFKYELTPPVICVLEGMARIQQICRVRNYSQPDMLDLFLTMLYESSLEGNILSCAEFEKLDIPRDKIERISTRIIESEENIRNYVIQLCREEFSSESKLRLLVDKAYEKTLRSISGENAR